MICLLLSLIMMLFFDLYINVISDADFIFRILGVCSYFYLSYKLFVIGVCNILFVEKE